MPFSRNSELPSAVRDSLPSKAQSVFRNVVNSQLEEGLPESRAFASAWSTLRRQGWRPGKGGGKWVKVEKRIRQTGETANHRHNYDDTTGGDTSQNDGHVHAYELGAEFTGMKDGHRHKLPSFDIEKTVWNAEFKIEKVDQYNKEVFGFASIIEKEDGTPLVDLQGDIIEEEELEKAVYDYVINSRVGGLMHREMDKAVLIESFVITNRKRDLLKLSSLPLGWWVGYKVLDDDVFNKVLNGSLTMFSIGGTALKVPVEASS